MDRVKRIPVILDTDIGGDIDDTWALALLLNSPELDIKMVLTSTGNTTYRAKIVAKMLEIAGRTDIPVGIGFHQKDDDGRQRQILWVKDYILSSYPGGIYKDGISAFINAISGATEQMTLIAIGPLTNIKLALERKPGIFDRLRFVGMLGSINRRHYGKEGAIAEYNVVCDIPAAQKVFTAGWDMTITPLDTCGVVKLSGERYQKILKSQKPVTRAVIENYRVWSHDKKIAEKETSLLYDTVAIYLAFSQELLVMEKLGIKVTDDGYTCVDKNAKKINCAIAWKNLSAFEDFLVHRLT